ncbi:MAG TPA: protein-disulfide reductase DsbD domain-containing protein [Rhizomicrobium sp.]|jgi:thiol:disulfide interchange protein DsbD|nr:protein-disulfide reductase DsbD domain-containing protein [Rhizomicrobium sp.]
MQRFALALLLAFAATTAQADIIGTTPKVQARLIAQSDSIAPGQTVTVALEQVITPGWHTYWVNPGEAGLPTTLDWKLPQGWKTGALEWPYPKRLPVGPLMNYGYEGKVWTLTSVTAPVDAKPGAMLTLPAKASWLVCKEVCIPEDQTVMLAFTVAATPSAPDPKLAAQFATARDKIPTPSPWPMRFHVGDNVDLFIASPALVSAQPTDVEFFPAAAGEVKDFAPQTAGTASGGLVLRMTPGEKSKSIKSLTGVLVLTSSDGSVRALNVNAAPGEVPQANFSNTGSESGDMTWLAAIAFAFLGGLILNLMPCVLPILAMKALAIASKVGADKREAAHEGLGYGAGAILSFVALGAAILILRAGGNAIGWGFQLQNPVAVAAFALLIFAVGLNLSGVFELPAGVSAGDALTRKGGVIGAFFTGVLAVAVAAPCTAPFMAAALGFALSQPAAIALLIFVALGLGFAAPFVLVGLAPGLLKFLPHPGAWMLRFKQALAFPMYAAAAWLVWVLAQEAGSMGVVAALAAMVTLGFAAWSWGASREANTSRWRMIGAIAALLAFIASLALLSFANVSAPANAVASAQVEGIPSEPYSAARLQSLRAANRPVFVDATAAWCITCLVNEKVAFSNQAVRDGFAQKHIAYLVADWTNRNPEITALLAAHGRSGVPLYLYYAPGADAQVLPQVLTEGSVLAAIGTR